MGDIVPPWASPGQGLGSRCLGGSAHGLINYLLQAIIALTFFALLLVVWLENISPALAVEIGDARIVPQGPLDFDGAARLAIRQSPYMVQSALEINIRRMDESDSRLSILPPPVSFRTYYYVDRPNQPGLGQPYSLSFTIDPWNPFGSYFNLQAQKVATQMAIFSHLKMVNQGLERVGKIYLHLAATKRLIAIQRDIVNLKQESLTYATNRQSIGTGTSLDVKVASQELEMARMEAGRLESIQNETLTNLKTFLGLKPEQQITLDLHDAPRQVLGSFNPATASLEQAKARSFDLKALELKKKVQGYNVTIAKVHVLPDLLFNAQTPDPLSVTSARGLYVGLGLQVPVWDGFKRIRNISRQKAILKQVGAEKDVREMDVTDKWNKLQNDIKNSATDLKITQSQEELAQLKERQAEIRYNSGTDQLPALLSARSATLVADKNTISKKLDYNDNVLSLREFSGDLGYSYVDPKSWEK